MKELAYRKVIFVLGNHDARLRYYLHNKIPSHWKICEEVNLGGYIIFHGDKEPADTTGHTFVLSHEHASVNIRDNLGKAKRMKAVVELKLTVGEEKKNAIILPASNHYSSGVSFPLRRKNMFLSPFLRKYADIKSQRIHAFDDGVGPIKLR